MSAPERMNRGTHTGSAANPLPATMMAATSRRYGDSEVLSIESMPTPAPGPGELLVRVMASSANALDWHLISGTPLFVRLVKGLRAPKHVIQGADVAGIVEAVGEGADGFAVGDRVFGEADGGAFAQYATVKATMVAPLPPGVDFAAAGATPVAGLTALQGLRTHGGVKTGDRVLINGAAGGVGTFAIQIARALGAGEITAVCSTGNVDQSRALGATRVVDYLHEDFVAAGGTYDVVLDMMVNRTAQQMRGILAPGARYVAVSGPMTNRLLGPVLHLVRMGLAMRRADASFHQFTANATTEDLTFLGELLVSGQLAPAIERTVALDGVAGAIDQVASGHGSGKIVIVPGDGSARSGDERAAGENQRQVP